MQLKGGSNLKPLSGNITMTYFCFYSIIKIEVFAGSGIGKRLFEGLAGRKNSPGRQPG